MIFTKKYLAALVLCGAFHAVADDTVQVSKSPDLSSLQNPNVVTQFLDRVDTVINMFNGENIDFVRATSIAQQIETRVQFNLVKEVEGKNVTFTPAKKSRAATNILSPVRYSALEDACVIQSKSSNEVARIISMRILSQSLGSAAGKNRMLSMLDTGMNDLMGDNKLSVSSKELFAVAEGLAFLKEPSGVEVLESVLSSRGSPSFLKRRAIKALDYLEIPFSKEMESNLLLSDDAAVAFAAFDLMESQYTNSTVSLAAISQLKRLYDVYHTDGVLAHNQRALLGTVSYVLKNSLRQKSLSTKQRKDTKNMVVLFANSKDKTIQERVAYLFAELAEDEDSELILRLLMSNSVIVRSNAALAISHCSQNIIQEQKEVLITLLDNKSDTVRNFALYALRKGLGEKASNYLSDAEYKSQKARVLALYAR
jgi:HEAT repeat protein